MKREGIRKKFMDIGHKVDRLIELENSIDKLKVKKIKDRNSKRKRKNLRKKKEYYSLDSCIRDACFEHSGVKWGIKGKLTMLLQETCLNRSLECLIVFKKELRKLNRRLKCISGPDGVLPRPVSLMFVAINSVYLDAFISGETPWSLTEDCGWFFKNKEKK